MRMKLFTVGPVEMYPETLEESGKQLPYFRTPEFSSLMLESEQMILELAGASAGSRTVFLTASGTGAMEAVVINCFNKTDHVLIVDGGSFGHRFVQLCERHHIPTTVAHLKFGETLTEKQLQEAYQDDMTALVVNLHETSTGQLYDINMLHKFCREHSIYLIVDAISSFLADPIHMDTDGIDVLILSSQKVFSLAPGISIALLSPRTVDLVQQRGTDVMYFDFRDYLANGERGQTPYTPAVGTLLTLHKRLEQIQRDGLEHIMEAIRELALDFRNRIQGLPVIIPDYPHSNAMTPIYFPDGQAKKVYEVLRVQYGLNVTPNGGELADTLLRVGHMGNLTLEDNTCLVNALKGALLQIVKLGET